MALDAAQGTRWEDWTGIGQRISLGYTTLSRDEIFFYKSSKAEINPQKIVSSSYDFGMIASLRKNKNRFFASL